MKRRNFVCAGLSLSAIAFIPLRTLAQGKQQNNFASEIPQNFIAQGESLNHVTTNVLDMMRGKWGGECKLIGQLQWQFSKINTIMKE